MVMEPLFTPKGTDDIFKKFFSLSLTTGLSSVYGTVVSRQRAGIHTHVLEPSPLSWATLSIRRL